MTKVTRKIIVLIIISLLLIITVLPLTVYLFK